MTYRPCRQSPISKIKVPFPPGSSVGSSLLPSGAHHQKRSHHSPISRPLAISVITHSSPRAPAVTCITGRLLPPS